METAHLKGKLALAYTAGFFDGEGCISITKRKTKTINGYSYQLFVSVWSTDEWVIQWLKMQYGGSTLCRPANGNKKPIYKWCLASNKACPFLSQILPYLNLKRPQAEMALAFQTKNTKLRKTEKQLADMEAERIRICGMNSGKNKRNKEIQEKRDPEKYRGLGG
jgi:hypothetical protein